jgi:glucose/arabinose dehydrogenase
MGMIRRWCLIVILSLSAYVLGCVPTSSLESTGDSVEPTGKPERKTDGEAPPTAHFERVVLDSTTTRPNELAVASDGRVFYIEREGAVKMWDPETQSTSMIGFIPVKAIHTNGLLGLALDPTFEENGWMYFYYSPRGNDEHNVLARYTFDEGRIQAASRQEILRVPVDRYVEGGPHSAGSLAFGPDGLLYLSTGDNTNPTEVDLSTPIDERPGREDWDAQRSAGNTNDLRGKILRIRPLPDGQYEVPAGNLFPYGAVGRPEIFVMGNRNPFRIAVDPKTGWLFWGDYGPSAPGNEKRGAAGYDEFNLAREAGNYGWPFFVADNKPFRKYDFAADTSGRYFDPEAPINDSPNNTGARLLPPARPALIWYPSGPSEKFPELGAGGRGPMGGAVYRYEEEKVGPYGLPAHYDGAFFIMEFMRHWLKDVRVTEEGELRRIDPFLSEMTFQRPFDMTIGPKGRIFMIEWGQNYEGWFNDHARIIRIDYHGTEKRPPVARIDADTTSGPAPLSVTFTGDSSYSRVDEDSLEYAWNFDGDGSIDATDPDPTHRFERPGTYPVTLTVTDAEGRTADARTTVTVGNTAPVVTIDWPLHGGVIDLDRSVDFELTAHDREDGEISPEKLSIRPQLGHDSHRHVVDRRHTAKNTFKIRLATRHMFLENLYAALEVSYTDQGASDAPALSTTREVIMQPRRKDAVHIHTIHGAERVIEGDYRLRDTVETYLDVGPEDYVSYAPINLHGIDGITFRVASETGGVIEARVGRPDGNLLGTVTVEAESDTTSSNGHSWQEVTMPITDPGGTNEIFLVFRGETNEEDGLIRMDWLEFQGEGMMKQPAANSR